MPGWRQHRGLLGSLAVNVVLGAAVGWLLLSRKPAVESAAFVPPGTSGADGARFSWSAVRSNDYVAYAGNLRALGVPEASVVDLIVGEVSAKFAARLRKEAPAAPKYWQTADLTSGTEQTRLRELHARLERERREVLEKALGPQALQAMGKYQWWHDVDPVQELLTFLPADKLRQLQAINAKYAANAPDDEALLTEVAARKLAADRTRQRAEIESLLSPQELEDFDLRKSDTAERLRGELRGFAASEAEFRQLFRVRRAYESALATNTDVRDPNVLQVRIEAERRFAEEARAALGDARYADYQRARDPDFQNALQVTQFYSLPADIATRVYDLKRDVDARAAGVTGNAALTEQRRRELLGQMERDTERTLQSLLGSEVLAEYRRNNRWWMWGE